jgi:hypothetical protein
MRPRRYLLGQSPHVRTLRQGESARNWGLGIILIGWALALAMSAPGHLTYDSMHALNEGRLGVFSGHQPPIIAVLIGLCDRIWTGTGLYLLLCQAVFYVPMLLYVVSVPITAVGLGAVAIAVLSPLMLLYQGIV